MNSYTVKDHVFKVGDLIEFDITFLGYNAPWQNIYSLRYNVDNFQVYKSDVLSRLAQYLYIIDLVYLIVQYSQSSTYFKMTMEHGNINLNI